MDYTGHLQQHCQIAAFIMNCHPPLFEYIHADDLRMLTVEGYYTRPFIQRDDHAALVRPAMGLTPTMLGDLQDMLSTAVVDRQLPVPYSVGTRREVQSVSHHVVDLWVARNCMNAALIQVRMSRLDKTKGTSSERRRYVLLTNFASGLFDMSMASFSCEARAREHDFLGQVIGGLVGLSTDGDVKPDGRLNSAVTVLTRDSDGTLRSVFDGFEYLMSHWYSQAAAVDCWGNYCFRNIDMARRYARRRSPFRNARHPGRDLVLCKVTTSGPVTKFGGGMDVAAHMNVGEILGNVDD